MAKPRYRKTILCLVAFASFALGAGQSVETLSAAEGASPIDLAGNAVDVVTTGRHDPCVGLRATPIAEAMLALALMDHYLRHRAQNADVRSSTPAI